MGVRMLVPLVDMLNHAGDYITSPPGSSSAGAPPAVQAYDNVRCCGSLLCFMLASSLAWPPPPPPPALCVWGRDQPTPRLGLAKFTLTSLHPWSPLLAGGI